MLKKILLLLVIFSSIKLYAQEMDTLIIFDYWESDPMKIFIGKTGYSEDYLQVIINGKDRIDIDARKHKKEIIFTHPFNFTNNDGMYNRKVNKSFGHSIKFAGLQIVKPIGEEIIIRAHTIHTNQKEFANKKNFDTVLSYSTLQDRKTVLWNLHLFNGAMAETKNYFYPRYTLHSHNWPTPQQWAKYRKRRKVLKQIENAIVYRYNTVTRQIIKS